MDRRQIRKGSIQEAFDQADVIVQGVYRPAAIEHVPVETQVCQVVPEADGRLTIYSCTQALYFSMGVVAAHLEVPLNRLKFVGGTVGGGFGGRSTPRPRPCAALLALKCGKPVKWRWTREEDFLCSSTRAPWHMEIADAVTKDGWILGRKMLTLHDSGAYSRFSPYGRRSTASTTRARTRSRISSSTGTASTRIACRRPRCAASGSPPSRSRSRRT